MPVRSVRRWSRGVRVLVPHPEGNRCPGGEGASDNEHDWGINGRLLGNLLRVRGLMASYRVAASGYVWQNFGTGANGSPSNVANQAYGPVQTPSLPLLLESMRIGPLYPYPLLPLEQREFQGAQDVAPGGSNVYDEFGSILAASLVSGEDIVEASETGAIAALGLLSGADAIIATESGALLAALLLSGGDSRTAVEAGSTLAAVLLAGPKLVDRDHPGSILASV